MSRVVLCVAMLAACASRTGAHTEPATPMVVLHPTGAPQVRVQVELARSQEERSRGLMYREHLDPTRGMLFLFEQEQQQGFWMKNTYIALDMIFITKDKRVLGVVENAEPLTLVTRSVPGKSQFVLEVVAGFARSHGIGPGTPVEFLHVE